MYLALTPLPISHENLIRSKDAAIFLFPSMSIIMTAKGDGKRDENVSILQHTYGGLRLPLSYPGGLVRPPISKKGAPTTQNREKTIIVVGGI